LTPGAIGAILLAHMKRIAILLSTLAVVVLAAPARQAAAQQPAPGERVAQSAWLTARLPRYQALAAKSWPGPLPGVKKLSPGDAYAGIAPLSEILRDLGDLPESAALPADGTYSGPLVDAVKAFQQRHGLTPDGVVGPASLTALNHPYSTRLEPSSPDSRSCAPASIAASSASVFALGR